MVRGIIVKLMAQGLGLDVNSLLTIYLQSSIIVNLLVQSPGLNMNLVDDNR